MTRGKGFEQEFERRQEYECSKIRKELFSLNLANRMGFIYHMCARVFKDRACVPIGVLLAPDLTIHIQY